MSGFSRREALAGLAMVSAASVTHARQRPAGATTQLAPVLSAAERTESFSTLLAYFQRVGPSLFRQPGGFLKHPTLSPSQPGKQYSAELWDWDTYWTARGLFRLAQLTRDTSFRKQLIEHAQGSVAAFFDAQSSEGRIPVMISAKKQDFFQSTKPVPRNPHNQCKPILAQLARLIADESGSAEWFRPYFPALLRFYDSWGKDNLSPVGLYVWGNDVASGDDNDPTTFGRPDFSSANVLLNCLFYADLEGASELAHRLALSEDAARLKQQADRLAEAIRKTCWDPRDRFFYTVDVQCSDRRSEWLPGLPQGMAMSWASLPLRIQVSTGFLPLWCGIATPQQAAELVNTNYLADDRFRANYGVRSLSSFETMYALTPMSGNPSNWLGPIWIISNYFAWKGLQRYGFTREARNLADKTIKLLATDISKSGTLNEYYHPDSGAPLSHRGFVDWNLLVLEMVEA